MADGVQWQFSRRCPARLTVEFNDVLAVSASEGQIARPESNAVVTGEILSEGRGKKNSGLPL